jgi:hypothetical protein
MIGWCQANGYDYRSVEGQLHYLQTELNGGYYNVLECLLNVPDTEDGAYEAGHYFCMHFEIPDSVATRSDARGTIAKKTYFPADLSEYLADPEGKAEKTDDVRTESADDFLNDLLEIPDQHERVMTATQDILFPGIGLGYLD